MWTNNNQFNTAPFNASTPAEIPTAEDINFRWEWSEDSRIMLKWSAPTDYFKFVIFKNGTALDDIFEARFIDETEQENEYILRYYYSQTEFVETEAVTAKPGVPGKRFYHESKESSEPTFNDKTGISDGFFLNNEIVLSNISGTGELLRINGQDYILDHEENIIYMMEDGEEVPLSDFGDDIIIETYDTDFIIEHDNLNFDEVILKTYYHAEGKGWRDQQDGEVIILAHTDGHMETFMDEIEEGVFEEVYIYHEYERFEGVPAVVETELIGSFTSFENINVSSVDSGIEFSLDGETYNDSLNISQLNPGERTSVYVRLNIEDNNQVTIKSVAGDVEREFYLVLLSIPFPDLEGNIIIARSEKEDLEGSLIVRNSEKEDLESSLTVRQLVEEDLNSRLAVQQETDYELPGDMVVRQSADYNLDSNVAIRVWGHDLMPGHIDIPTTPLQHDLVASIEVRREVVDVDEFIVREKFDLSLVGIDDLEEGIVASYDRKLEMVRDLYEFPFKKVFGLVKLVGYVKKILLTSYGSDPNNPEYGSYLKNMIGSSYSDLDSVGEQLQREVQRVKQQIISFQNEYEYHIPPEEKLSELRLIRIYEDKELDIWSVNADYLIITEAGERYEGKLFSEES